MNKQNNINKNKKTFRYIGLGILLLIFTFVFSNNAKKEEEQKIDNLFEKEIVLNIQKFKDQGAEHISEFGNFEYNSNPPTSGPHYAQAPSWGFYSEAIDDESALHAVEHGGIWISYRDLSEPEIELLKDFAETNNQSVIITPRALNDAAISVVSWTKLVNFESVDVDALQKFLLLLLFPPLQFVLLIYQGSQIV